MKTRMLLTGLALGAAILNSGCRSRSCRQPCCPPVAVPVARPCPTPCCPGGPMPGVAVPLPAAGPPVAAQPPLAVSGYAPAPCPNGNCGR